MSDEDYNETYRSFYRSGTTDGLPIIPPTEERVKEMLTGTDLSPETELGRLGDRGGLLTVETLAVNAVMAGCLPIHMPVLEAGARVLSDAESSLVEASVGTDSSAQIYLVNGPVRNQLDINSGTGAFGPGFRSNQTIGRALGLATKNTADIHPGEQAMGVLGNPFKYYSLAGENEEQSPWEPYHVEQGYDTDESTITLTNANGFVQSWPPEIGAEGVLRDIIHNTPAQMGFRGGAIYAISPFNAADLSELSKREVKEYIAENATSTTRDFNAAHLSTYKPDDPDTKVTEKDELPPLRTHVFDDPEEVLVFVTGGEGKWNGVIGPMEGGPTTAKIELPDNWDELLEEYADDLERDWGQPQSSQNED